MATLTMSALDGGSVEIQDSAIESLAGSIRGDLIRPEEPGYDEAVLIWNGMVQKRPALVLRAAAEEDVVAAVNFARENGVLMSIKCGGHNIAGTSLAERGFTLDMSRMAQVDVDPGARTAAAAGGCLLKHIDAATQEHGLAATLGFVSETGASGLTLGGGFGYLTRRFGWTVDGLREARVVTADGKIRRAAPDENEELFWALRGGGGNFGVVTQFTHELHEVGPMVTGGLIAWGAEEAQGVLDLYREVTVSAPREQTTVAAMRYAPPAPFVPEEWHGKPIIALIVCHSGSPEAAARDLAPIRSFGSPIADVIAEKPYVAQQSMLDATQPKGLHYYWKSEYIQGLPADFLDAYHAAARSNPAPLSQVIMFHLEGALNERDPDDGAVGNREARWVTATAGCWAPDAPDAAAYRSWVTAGWETLRPFSTGNYVNFQNADDDASRIRESYGANFDRLARVKHEYDPDNLFRLNRNVAPGESGP